jgi:hypothetical protein
MNEKEFVATWNHNEKSLTRALFVNGKNWIESVKTTKEYYDIYYDIYDKAIDFLNKIYHKPGGGSVHALAKGLSEVDFNPMKLATMAFTCGCIMFEQTPEHCLFALQGVITKDKKSIGLEDLQKFIIKDGESETVGGISAVIALGVVIKFLDKIDGLITKNGYDLNKIREILHIKCDNCPAKDSCHEKIKCNEKKERPLNDLFGEDFHSEKFNKCDPRFN